MSGEAAAHCPACFRPSGRLHDSLRDCEPRADWPGEAA